MSRWKRRNEARKAKKQSRAFGDAAGTLDEMISMMRDHGPTTVLPGFETMHNACQVAAADDPTVVDAAAARIRGVRRTISRPLSDLVIHAETNDDRVGRNKRFAELQQQLSIALDRAMADLY